MEQELLNKIRDRAYHLWDAEGRHEGREVATWLRAEAEVVAAKTKPATKPKRKAAPKKAATKKTAAKKSLAKMPRKTTTSKK